MSLVSPGSPGWLGWVCILTEVVCHELLVFERMLRPNGDNGLTRLHGLEALGPAGRLPPGHLLFKYMEESYHVAQTAVDSVRAE